MRLYGLQTGLAAPPTTARADGRGAGADRHFSSRCVIAYVAPASLDPAANRETIESAVCWFRDVLESRYRDHISYGNGAIICK
jgi:hypothetical protein